MGIQQDVHVAFVAFARARTVKVVVGLLTPNISYEYDIEYEVWLKGIEAVGRIGYRIRGMTKGSARL